MNHLLKKLQFKNQKEIFILNHPSEFNDSYNDIENYTEVLTDLSGKDAIISFVLVFVKSIAELDIYLDKIKSHLNDDTILWFAYPKKSSKIYKSDISRDNGWQGLGKISFEPVMQIAIDDNWSALRFRHLSQIKNFTRNKAMILSEAGKNRQNN